MSLARGRSCGFPIESFFPESSRKRDLTVLVVDDDVDCCSGLCRLLQSLGCTALQLVDGKGILPVIEQAKPDVVLLDVALRLPVDGFEVCRQLKNGPATRALTVALVSGLDRSGVDARHARGVGAAAFLSKPVKAQDLLGLLERACESRNAGDAASRPAAPGGKVLVLDDDPEWLSLTSSWLKQAGHDVVPCPKASALFRLIEQSVPDCVVLDFDLRDRSADSICRELRARTQWNGIQLIGHSAHPEVEGRMLDQGADHFVVKSGAADDLLRAVRVCLRRRRWESGVLVQRDLRLDASARRVEWSGAASTLSEEQFRFVERLVRTPDQWVSLKELSALLGRSLSEAAAKQLAVRLKKCLGPGLGRRFRFDRAFGWIYETSAEPPSAPH